jgi:hypothetical protein
MGGRASRDKGARGERNLKAELLRLGWHDVYRVPLSGAAQGFKSDVLARPPGLGQEWSFELKCRRAGFESIYTFLFMYGGSCAFSLADGTCIRVSYYPDNMIGSSEVLYLSSDKFPEADQSAIRKIVSCRKWLGEADVLVLKQDRKPWIFIRYR